MNADGGCYCGEIRYHISGPPRLKGQCHCRECQHISGGGPNYFMLIANDDFTYTQGTVKSFTRSDLDQAVTREFCGQCGTHLITRRPDMDMVVVKIGTLDTPALFEAPQMAIFTVDEQKFHMIPKGLPKFEKLPG
ncbi:MAG: GFA family protein [bacterium]